MMTSLRMRIRAAAYPLIVLSSAAAWGVALFLQHGLGMQPCSLCILQRWALTAVLLSSVAAWALRRLERRWLNAPLAVSSLAGIVVSAKHLWLQLSPHAADAGCGFGGSMLLDNFPLTDALPALFAGSGDCATLPPVLGAPLPLWSLVYFLGVAVVLACTVTRDKSTSA